MELVVGMMMMLMVAVIAVVDKVWWCSACVLKEWVERESY